MNKTNIKNILQSYPFRIFLFVESAFILFRLFFVGIIFLKNKNLESSEIPLLFLHSIRLDLAAVSYVAALPILLWIVSKYFPAKWLQKSTTLFTWFILPLLGIILFTNLIVYYAWGTIINARAVSFLSSPKEILASLSTLQLILFFILIFSLTYIFIKTYHHTTHSKFERPITAYKHFILIWILILPITIRGGIQQIPINESICMFSKNENANLASINPFWYLINSIYKAQNINANAYHFMDDKQSSAIMNTLYKANSDSSIIITNDSCPNIVTIVLESWTADVIESLGGEKDVTPFFHSLESQGLLFENIYAAGKRTDLMFPSLLSGFPAMPNVSVMKYSDKSEHLPFITNAIKQKGYQTSFNYGGELEFANMKSYLTQAKFDVIKGKESFPIEQWTSKWGVYDEVLFGKSIATINELKPPFYATILTQSTHEPFAIPIAPKFEGSSESVKFKNAAYYTDCCLRQFFEKVKKEKWYNNTLFILVADHGHILPRNRDYSEPAAFKIPILITGPALKQAFQNKIISEIGNQQDYAATIKSILHLKIELPFSNNLLNATRTNFCYMNYDDGFVWKNDKTTFKYNYSTKTTTFIGDHNDSTSVKEGMSFIQSAYQYFVNL